MRHPIVHPHLPATAACLGWPADRGSVEASVRHVCLVVVIVPVVSRVKFHRRTFRYESCVEVSRDSCHVHGFENGGRERVEILPSHPSQPAAICIGNPYMSGLQIVKSVDISILQRASMASRVTKSKKCDRRFLYIVTKCPHPRGFSILRYGAVRFG